MILHSRPWLLDEDIRSVAAVLSSHMIAQGEATQRFEQELAEWVGVAHPGVAVGSGTAALHLILSTLNIGAGDAVALPTYVCHSVLEAVISAGATPQLCDVGDDWLLTPKNVERVITPKTRAVIVPHLYGLFADVDAFRGLGITIIEDCAQAIGRRGEAPVRGDVALFSFHPTKCLTTGEGGMVVSRDAEFVERARLMRDGDGIRPHVRHFSPLSDIAAALGRSQLARFSDALDRRAAMAAQYLSALEDVVGPRSEWMRKRSMFFRFPVLVDGGLDRVEGPFAARGVIVRRGVDRLLHRMIGLRDDAFPTATDLFNRTVSLPLYPSLTDAEFAVCVDAAREILASSHAHRRVGTV